MILKSSTIISGILMVIHTQLLKLSRLVHSFFSKDLLLTCISTFVSLRLQALKEKVQKLGLSGNSILLHRNVKIVDETGKELICFPEFLTRMYSKKIITRILDEEMFEVRLVDPKATFFNAPPPSAATKAVDELMRQIPLDGLFELEKCCKEEGWDYEPHLFPKKYLEDKNQFKDINLMPLDLLEHYTGQKVLQYWKTVQKFADSSIMTHMPKGLTPAQVVLLFR